MNHFERTSMSAVQVLGFWLWFSATIAFELYDQELKGEVEIDFDSVNKICGKLVNTASIH